MMKKVNISALYGWKGHTGHLFIFTVMHVDDLKSHLNLQPYMAVIIIAVQYLGNAVQPVQHGLIVDEQRLGCLGRVAVG